MKELPMQVNVTVITYSLLGYLLYDCVSSLFTLSNNSAVKKTVDYSAILNREINNLKEIDKELENFKPRLREISRRSRICVLEGERDRLLRSLQGQDQELSGQAARITEIEDEIFSISMLRTIEHNREE